MLWFLVSGFWFLVSSLVRAALDRLHELRDLRVVRPHRAQLRRDRARVAPPLQVAEDDGLVVERLPLVGRFRGGARERLDRLVELPVLLVANAEVRACRRILADRQRALEVLR